MKKTIVVLNDGETYTDISGCCILVLTETGYNALGTVINDPGDLPPEMIIAEIALRDVTIRD